MVNIKPYFLKKRILIFPLSFLLPCFFIAIIFGSIFLEKKFLLKEEKIFYAPPLNYLKVVSGSFRSFCADIFYMRGILAISEELEKRSFWVDWVQKNFEIAISLDPKLTQSYFFGGVVVAYDKEGINKGIRFLERGLKDNPDEWQIPYWIGFNYYQAGDYLKATEYYETASNLPEAPKFLKTIQPMYYYRSGRPDLGVKYLEGLIESVNDPKQLELIKTKLKWLKGIVYLEEKVAQFKLLFGHLPKDLEELINTGLVKKVPQDAFGKGYYLDKDSQRIRSIFE